MWFDTSRAKQDLLKPRICGLLMDIKCELMMRSYLISGLSKGAKADAITQVRLAMCVFGCARP